jgi:hypothetical protein
MKKRKKKSHVGKPRQFPPCPRYRSHVFSPTTNRCPCGFQRPGTEAIEKTDPLVPYTFRLPSETLQQLESIAAKQDKGVSEIVRKAIEKWLKGNDPSRGF